MARKQSERAKILAEIRRCHEELERLDLKIVESTKNIMEINRLLGMKVRPTAIGLRTNELQAKLLLFQRRIRFSENKKQILADLVVSRENDLAVLAASEVTGGEEWPLSPGWRWVSTCDRRYVWSTDGRVGSLKKNTFGTNWTLTLLKPVRRGTFKLRIGGLDVVRSFSTIARQSAAEDLVAEFGEYPQMDATVVSTGERVVVQQGPRRSP